MEVREEPKKKQALLGLSDDDDDDIKPAKASAPAASKPAPSLDPKAAESTDAASSNRFMNMIYSFTSFLTRRKTAFTGRPASVIQWDPVKGRYVIEGEPESEEEEVKAPPKITKKENKPKEEEKKKPEE